jgi:hypothetical protein
VLITHRSGLRLRQAQLDVDFGVVICDEPARLIRRPSWPRPRHLRRIGTANSPP